MLQARTQLVQSVERSHKKSKACQQYILSLLNSIVGAIEKTINDIANIDNPSPSQIKQCLKNLHNSISALKPYSHIKQTHAQIHKKISRIGKQLDSIITSHDFTLKNPFGILDSLLVEAVVLQHFLKQGQSQSARVIESPQKLKRIYEDGINMYNQIRRGQYENSIKWVTEERLFELFQCDLEFQLRKRQFLCLANRKQISEAIEYSRSYFNKFVDAYMDKIQYLIGFLLFDECQLGHRYSSLRGITNNNQDIAKRFLAIYYDRNGISTLDPLQICFKAGVKAEPYFKQYERILGEPSVVEKQMLPFSIDFQQFKYHSMFVCPVSKQMLGSEQRCIVLKCGHVISQSGYSKLFQARNKIKLRCPVCHADQKPNETVEMHF